MTGKLLLYLKGHFVQEADITLPAFQDLVDDSERNFELNCQIREEFVHAETVKFRCNYLRSILKCKNEYEIYLQLESKPETEIHLTEDFS